MTRKPRLPPLNAALHDFEPDPDNYDHRRPLCHCGMPEGNRVHHKPAAGPAPLVWDTTALAAGEHDQEDV